MIDESRLLIAKYGLDLTKQGYHPYIKEGQTIQEYMDSKGNLLYNSAGSTSFIGYVEESDYQALSIIDFDSKDNIIGATEIKKENEKMLYLSYKVGSDGILRISNSSDETWNAEFYSKENLSLVGKDFDFVYSSVIFTKHGNPIGNKIFEIFRNNFIIPDLTLSDTTLDGLLLQVRCYLKDKIELLSDKKKHSVRK